MQLAFENSNPERFQQFCQALLLAEYPHLQCFPTGQPDGGRDGLDPDSDTVLQVKFKRRNDDDSAEWVINALNGELPKIRRLEAQGAARYVLATNAQGTGHPGVGRIDLVQEWFSDNLEIPGTCVWRDDLERRFEVASSAMKCHYPEFLNGLDAIQLAIDGLLGERTAARRRAISMFVSGQFQADEKVKFKQIDLSNSLIDLFVDVPVALTPGRRLEDGASNWDLRNREGATRRLTKPILNALQRGALHLDGDSDVGAAELILALGQESSPAPMTLYGAPGQGKSTIGQYVCQVQRMLFLGKEEQLRLVPRSHIETSLRIPFKVDLRDFSTYLAGRDPFSQQDLAEDHRALEGFLTLLVRHYSSGMSFSRDDLLALLEVAPSLFFFDGLDEVAEQEARGRVIKAIAEGLERARDVCHADLQVVVTTRPSAFGKVPELPDTFRATLCALSPARIEQYSGKWVKARSLEDVEAKEVKRVLRQKVELTHIRDLTRNPMQLAIMLNLIQTIGQSLPDRRTDLYSRYLDIFLTREAEKSAHVRDNRDLLLDFVSFLAWHLQCQAELPRSAGGVASDDLLGLVQDYLARTGHPDGLAEGLFRGGLDRIFVLVQRIDGFYEFEVQPLREYFCARHLFTTAPAASFRDPQVGGDHAQRFEAIAASPFWLNVVRFYAGFYDRGMLSSLLYSIEGMLSVTDVALALHARRVAFSLLADSVFSAKPLVQNDLILKALDGLACDTLRALALETEAVPALPESCGRAIFARSVLAELKTQPLSGRAARYCALIRANWDAGLAGEFRRIVESSTGVTRSMWIDRMARSGTMSADCLDLLEPEVGCDLIEQGARYASVLSYAPLELQGSPYAGTALNCILEGVSRSFGPSTPLSATAAIIAQPHSGEAFTSLVDGKCVGPEEERCRNFIRGVAALTDGWRRTSFPAFKADATASVVDLGTAEFGRRWCFLSEAVRYAGISAAGRGVSGVSLFHSGVPLSVAARGARLRRGAASSWKADLEEAASDEDRMFWAAMIGAWGSASAVEVLREDIENVTQNMCSVDFRRVAQAVRRAVKAGGRSDRTGAARPTAVRSRSDLLLALGSRMLHADSILDGDSRLIAEASEFVADAQLARMAGAEAPWEAGLPQRADWYRAGELAAPEQMVGVGSHPNASGIAEVLRRHKEFPIGMVQEAASHALSRYRARRVGAVSSDQQWAFD